MIRNGSIKDALQPVTTSASALITICMCIKYCGQDKTFKMYDN